MEIREQLSLFEEDLYNEDKVFEKASDLPFETGAIVHIVILCEEKDDPESYYYLKDFEGKVGIIQKVIQQPTVQYEVLFGNKTACLYASEVRYGKPGE